jgi:phosphoglycerate dehydrogenase-like enzyme
MSARTSGRVAAHNAKRVRKELQVLNRRLRVGLICTKDFYERDVEKSQIALLNEFADFQWKEMNEPSGWEEMAGASDETEAELVSFAKNLDALVVCHGAPRITDSIMAQCKNLKFIGELEGDRFARRIDVEAAAARGIRAIDTTHGTSAPVAEWALGLILVALRNAGAMFRKLIDGEYPFHSQQERQANPGFANGELTGKRVGLLGFGHIGRRLLTYLKPFDTEIWVHDPYIAKEVTESLGVILTSLDNVLSKCDVVVCLVPLTPATEGMLGEREFSMLKEGAIFVNVSRGKVVQTKAMLDRLERGDIIAGLDVFDPEPIPLNSPILKLPNVFITPHVAGSAAGRRRLFKLMVDELGRFGQGHETLNDLSPTVMANRRGDTPTRDSVSGTESS